MIADRLGEIIAVLVAANKGGVLKVPPRPRPVTALDRARTARHHAQHQTLVRRLLPPRDEES